MWRSQFLIRSASGRASFLLTKSYYSATFCKEVIRTMLSFSCSWSRTYDESLWRGSIRVREGANREERKVTSFLRLSLSWMMVLCGSMSKTITHGEWRRGGGNYGLVSGTFISMSGIFLWLDQSQPLLVPQMKTLNHPLFRLYNVKRSVFVD